MVIEWAPFTLKPGVTETALLAASEELQRDFLARQSGFLRRELMRDGAQWTDLVYWDSRDALQQAMLAVAIRHIIEVFGAGARVARRVTTVLTRADGAFLARLRPGPSRRVEARFGGTHALRMAVGRRLTLLVPAAVRLRASSTAAAAAERASGFRIRTFGFYRGARGKATPLRVVRPVTRAGS